MAGNTRRFLDKHGLTEQQRRFVQEYAIDFNGTRAYLRAFSSRIKPKSAAVNAVRLLKLASVKLALEEEKAKQDDLRYITRERYHQELARIGLSDITDFSKFGPKGVRLNPSAILTQDQSAAISEVSDTDKGVKFRLHNKVEALKLIGQLNDFIKPASAVNVSFNNMTPEQVHDLAVKYAKLKIGKEPEKK